MNLSQQEVVIGQAIELHHASWANKDSGNQETSYRVVESVSIVAMRARPRTNYSDSERR